MRFSLSFFLAKYTDRSLCLGRYLTKFSLSNLYRPLYRWKAELFLFPVMCLNASEKAFLKEKMCFEYR